jgi:Tfp pilus assembly protein PilN
MRELEFLPAWYPKVRQRKRMVALQTWITLLVIGALGLWVLLAQRNVHAREVELTSLSSDLSQSETDLQRLENLQDVQRDLGRQMEIYRKIGDAAPTTRVMTTLEQMMPRDMSLLDLSMETDQTPQPTGATLAARASRHKPAGADSSNPRLRFRMHGVAPTDMDLAEFLAKLTGKAFFQNVELLFSHERTDHGHIMREFEVAFSMTLGAGGN